LQSVCRRRLDETAIALKSRRRDSEVNHPAKPISAADAEGVHLSKVKLAAIVTAVCATALAAVRLFRAGARPDPATVTRDVEERRDAFRGRADLQDRWVCR
jgi:hypothetical protein